MLRGEVAMAITIDCILKHTFWLIEEFLFFIYIIGEIDQSLIFKF